MDEAAVQDWLDRYVAAWRSYDARAIGALFAADAVYRFHPWDEGDEVVRGRDAIVANWLEDTDEPGSWSASYRPWVAADGRAVGVGVTRYFADDRETVEKEFHNALLLRFDDDRRCTEFTEIYLERSA